MRPIKIISWIVTLVFVVTFIVQYTNLPSVVPYGEINPATSPAYLAGMFLANAIIPIILWIITAVTKPADPISKNESTNKALNIRSNNPEIINLKKELLELEKKKKAVNDSYRLIKTSHKQGLIDHSKYERVHKEKLEEFNFIKSEIDRISKRIKAISLLSEKFNSLEKLSSQGVVSIEEKERKREELITNLTNRMKS